jgi:hypothetical protein
MNDQKANHGLYITGRTTVEPPTKNYV